MKSYLAIASKDIRLELRTKQVLNIMFAFSIIVVVIFSITFDNVLSNNQIIKQLAPALLWISFIFAGILGINRTIAAEMENGSLEALKLSPISSSYIYMGKTLSNVVLTLIVELVTIPVFIVLFNSNIPNLYLLLIIMITGTVGFSAVGIMLSALTINTRTREILLPVLLLPLLLPVIIPAVLATSKIFLGQGLENIVDELRIMVVYDIVFFTLASMLFEYTIEG